MKKFASNTALMPIRAYSKLLLILVVKTRKRVSINLALLIPNDQLEAVKTTN